MSFAFHWAETIGLILMLVLLLILYFHKFRFETCFHKFIISFNSSNFLLFRWIIFRRMCSLGGTIFLLRSVTMLITSLSVPGIHIQCESKRYGSFINKIKGAWNIAINGGLSVHGIRTCGDYMFSGHTVCSLKYILEFYLKLFIYNRFGLRWLLTLFVNVSEKLFLE